jgi:predicted O-methyltransferase YrrM
LWFASRIRHLTSIEHNEGWYTSVKRDLERNGFRNVDYHLIPKDKEENEAGEAAYVRLIDQIETKSLDFVLVDGVYRDHCTLEGLRVLRPGGVLIIDNVNWFLPCNSFSPNSRTLDQGPRSATWEEVYRQISPWRTIWTSSGVTDTAFYFKPCRP